MIQQKLPELMVRAAKQFGSKTIPAMTGTFRFLHQPIKPIALKFAAWQSSSKY